MKSRSKLSEKTTESSRSKQSETLSGDKDQVAQQAVEILNTIGEGVCIVGRDGTFFWANRRMSEFSESVKRGVSQRSIAGYEYFEQFFSNADKADQSGHTTDVSANEHYLSRKYSVTDDQSNRYFEMVVTPMLDEAGKFTQVATVVREATASRRLQQRINAIDKAGSELVRLEAENFNKLTVEQRINLLQDKIVRYAKQLLNFDHFVVRLLNRRNNKLEVLFGVGLPKEMHIELFANIENNGVTGYVAATGHSYICNSPACDPHYLPGLENVCCTLTVPLRLHDKIIGTLNVESHHDNAFGEEDRQMAEIFGRYIAIAINILNLMVVERHQTTGQAVELLDHQISEPINSILTQAAMMMEDYIGHDDIRHRLQSVIDNADKIKTAVKELRSVPKGIFDVRSGDRHTEPDPQLCGKRILVADDEEFIRQTIVNVLEEHNCITDMAGDGIEAVKLIEQNQYDLVICDITMPHANGYEVFAAARKADKQTSVILMTGFGYDPNHSVVRANREGLNAVLYKPFKVEQLMHEIRLALGLTDK